MVELFANSGDTHQTPRSAASDLCLHCLPVTHLGGSSLQWVKGELLKRGTTYSAGIFAPLVHELFPN